MTHHARPARQTGGAALGLKAVKTLGISPVEVCQTSPVPFCTEILNERREDKVFERYSDVVEVKDLCEMLGGISKKLAYKLLADGKVFSVKVGRTYKIPKESVTAYITGQSLSDKTKSA